MSAIVNQVNGNEIKISSQAAASIHEHGIVILQTTFAGM
jgi:hypothetical protein